MEKHSSTIDSHGDLCSEKNFCESYLNKLKAHTSILRVAIAFGADANPPGVDRSNPLNLGSSAIWRKFYLDLLKRVVSHIKGIKKIELIEVATPQEAIDLLDQGQVDMVGSPYPITRKLLEEYSALAVSCVCIDSVLLAYFNFAFTVDQRLPCDDLGSLGGQLNAALIDIGFPTFDQLCQIVGEAAQNIEDDDYIVIVNTQEQKETVQDCGVPAENIEVNPTIPQSPEELVALLLPYAEEFGSCNVAYLGYYPVATEEALGGIAPPQDVTTANLSAPLQSEPVPREVAEQPFGVPVRLPPELVSIAFGWIFPKYANNLLLWFQLAYDRICPCEETRFPSLICYPANQRLQGNTVGAFGPNVSYRGCLPFPFCPVCCQFSIRNRFIPEAALYEVFLPTLHCIKPNKKIKIKKIVLPPDACICPSKKEKKNKHKHE